MGVPGYSTAAKILGWIALGTGISGIATIAAGPKIDDSLIFAYREYRGKYIHDIGEKLHWPVLVRQAQSRIVCKRPKRKQTAEQRQRA